MIYDKNENMFKKKLYVVNLEPTISTLTALRSIQMAKQDSDGYRIRKYFTLKSILFIMFTNLKLVLRSYTSLYGIFMSASLTLYTFCLFVNIEIKTFGWHIQNSGVVLKTTCCQH